jgi:hypothetical protein
MIASLDPVEPGAPAMIKLSVQDLGDTRYVTDSNAQERNQKFKPRSIQTTSRQSELLNDALGSPFMDARTSTGS